MTDTAMGDRVATSGQLWGTHARNWADIQEAQFRPAFVDVLDRVGAGAGTRLLDLGCGAGMAAALAAGRGAEVAGIDASEAMLAIARERVPGGDFRLGDIENLPFGDASFDVVTAFNAVQFAADPVRVLSEARRVLRPGGTVVVMSWGDPEGMDAAALVAALKPLLPPPPPGAPGPFALSDATRLREIARAAGLTPEAVCDGDSPWVYPDEATALRGVGASGVAARASDLAGRAAVDAAHAAVLARFRQADGSYRLGATYRYLVARS
ncbi:MAG: class I SAM-dependent methyltransferase [Rhodobacteraceae bacterium]|nr:class I SAM-dependent methyltransferase [Paracoccaceae bacterium]